MRVAGRAARPLHRRSLWVAVALVLAFAGPTVSQERPKPHPVGPAAVSPPAVPLPPDAAGVPDARPLPIDLPTALRLAGVSPLDIAVAAERLKVAAAQYDRASLLWLPNLAAGVDYYRHDGQIQDILGTVFPTNRSSILVGGGPALTLPVGDAVYAPLAARQVVRARQADVRAARNDSTLAVAEAYFGVQQARGEVAGAADAVRRADDLVRRTEQLAPGLVPAVEVSRARAEAARRRQGVEVAYERWQVASADLARLLRLDPAAVVEPAEAPDLRVELVAPDSPVDDLIPVALTHRPELESQQALVQATLARLKHEKVRPLYPSVVLRGTASQTPGLSSGYFGGGINDFVGTFGGRNSMDLQLVWQLDNLGLGNRAAVRERAAENRLALVQLLQVQDRVAAEVVQGAARLKRSRNRVREAEEGVRAAADTAEKNIQGLSQTRRVGEQLALVFRPQEAVAAVTALDQAYRDFYAAVADSNRAQFALYRALGHPAELLVPVPPAGGGRPPAGEEPEKPAADAPHRPGPAVPVSVHPPYTSGASPRTPTRPR